MKVTVKMVELVEGANTIIIVTAFPLIMWDKIAPYPNQRGRVRKGNA
jgi:hypothetical protein